MKIGFTGTRKGMTDAQRTQLFNLLYRLKYPNDESDPTQPLEFHSGDCIGSDAEAHEIAKNYGYTTIGHPPDNDRYRAHCKYHKEYRPKPYLDRNKNIVNETEMLIATPDTDTEKIASGTWYTIRYARKIGKEVVVINPKETTNA